MLTLSGTQAAAAVAEPAGGPAALRLRSVSKVYDSAGGPVTAFSDITLDLAPGEIVCLLGPSGCGKSSLLRVAAGLEPPSGGGVWLYGEPLRGEDARIGVVFQEPRLLPWLTVRENISLPLRFAANGRLGRRGQRVDEVLELTGLTPFAHLRPAEISGGMAQRVALARALVREPEIILFDEPFAALDALRRMELQEWLVEIVADRSVAILFVTHDIEEALYLGDRIVTLTPHPGRIDRVHSLPLERPRDRTSKALYEKRSEILSGLRAGQETSRRELAQ